MGRLLPALAGLSLLAAGAVNAQEEEPFKVDRRSFDDVYPVIALAPIDATPYLQMSDEVAAIIEEELIDRLERQKYTVIPSARLAAIRAKMTEQVGGLIDPATGETDPAREQAVRDHAFRELWFTEDFDALAIAQVSILQVPIENDRAEWDGVEQRIEREGRSRNYTANVSVTSLTLGIYDAANKPVYVWYGGLEPLMYRDREQLVPLDPSQLFQDEDKIREAVEIATDPF